VKRPDSLPILWVLTLDYASKGKDGRLVDATKLNLMVFQPALRHFANLLLAMQAYGWNDGKPNYLALPNLMESEANRALMVAILGQMDATILTQHEKGRKVLRFTGSNGISLSLHAEYEGHSYTT
jgi:hypothetical protein